MPSATAPRLTTEAQVHAATAAFRADQADLSSAAACTLAARFDVAATFRTSPLTAAGRLPTGTVLSGWVSTWLRRDLLIERRPDVWIALWDATPDPAARLALLSALLSFEPRSPVSVANATPATHAALRDFFLTLPDGLWDDALRALLPLLWTAPADASPAMRDLLTRHVERLDARQVRWGMMYEAQDALAACLQAHQTLLTTDYLARVLTSPSWALREWAMTTLLPARGIPGMSGTTVPPNVPAVARRVPESPLTTAADVTAVLAPTAATGPVPLALATAIAARLSLAAISSIPLPASIPRMSWESPLPASAASRPTPGHAYSAIAPDRWPAWLWTILLQRLDLSDRPAVWAALWQANPTPAVRATLLAHAGISGDPRRVWVTLAPTTRPATLAYLRTLPEALWGAVVVPLMDVLVFTAAWDPSPDQTAVLSRHLRYLTGPTVWRTTDAPRLRAFLERLAVTAPMGLPAAVWAQLADTPDATLRDAVLAAVCAALAPADDRQRPVVRPVAGSVAGCSEGTVPRTTHVRR